MADVGLDAPKGLNERLMVVWVASCGELEAADSLTPAMAALLEEFVLALKGAEDARMAGVSIAEDKAAKRASQLADQLGLTPKMRRKRGVNGRQTDADPFAALDELEQRRKDRAQTA